MRGGCDFASQMFLFCSKLGELTPAEMSRLSAALNDGTLSEEARRMRVAGLLNSVVLAETASRNFELGMAEQRGQTENLKR